MTLKTWIISSTPNKFLGEKYILHPGSKYIWKTKQQRAMMNSKELESGHKSIRGTLRKPFPSSRHCQVHPASHPYSSQIQITNTFRKNTNTNTLPSAPSQPAVLNTKTSCNTFTNFFFKLESKILNRHSNKYFLFLPRASHMHLHLRSDASLKYIFWSKISNASIVAHYVSRLLHIALVIRNVKGDIWNS